MVLVLDDIAADSRCKYGDVVLHDVGRDRSPRKQRRGEETIERYGSIEEDRAPLPRFLLWTYIGVAVWVVAYAVWTGIEGIGV